MHKITIEILMKCLFCVEKYWKKYQYASKFVQLVKSKTPKVTLYTKYAKVMLMENSPSADLEVCFYDGESNIYIKYVMMQLIRKLNL